MSYLILRALGDCCGKPNKKAAFSRGGSGSGHAQEGASSITNASLYQLSYSGKPLVFSGLGVGVSRANHHHNCLPKIKQ